MSKVTLSLLALAFSILFLSGCAKDNPIPTPGQTVTGTGANGQDPYFINDQDIYTTNPNALKPRTPLNIGNADNSSPSNTTPGGIGSGPHPNSIASVYFDFNKSGIKADQRADLKDVANRMNSDSSLTVVINGHCDWKGTTEYNIGLGERRAKSVKQYLIGLGVSGSRIEIVSKGDLEAVVEGTKAQMAGDRRADVIPIN